MKYAQEVLTPDNALVKIRRMRACFCPAPSACRSFGAFEVLWGWEGARSVAKALYLEVDRGTGPQFLAADTNPNYTDSFPLPATPQKWKFRGIFQRDGEMIGQWSAWVEINVG